MNKIRLFASYIKNILLLSVLLYVFLSQNDYSVLDWILSFICLNVVAIAFYVYRYKTGEFDLDDLEKLSKYLAYEDKFSLIGSLKIVFGMEILVVVIITATVAGYYFDHSQLPQMQNILKGFYIYQIFPFYYILEGVTFKLLKIFKVGY